MADDFGGIVRDRYRLASGVHGELDVDVLEFESRLVRICERYLGATASDQARLAMLRTIHTNDLLLAIACATGSDAAWQRLYYNYGKYLADLSRHLLGGYPDREELGETIWIDLFLPDRSGQSRIASYDGRSSLATWLRVVVSNRIINDRQRREFSIGNIDSMPEPVDPSALKTVEARLARSRYQAMILTIFERVLAGLNHREALIVLMRYDQGLQLGEIARLFSVHQSTITRQLDRVVERLRGEAISLLASEYGLNHSQIEECLNVACDTFASSVSILGFLKVPLAPQVASAQ